MSPSESKPESQCTGPRTPSGKAKSAMNAMRHGLTGRVVVLPTEDLNVYRAFCEELMAGLAPETAIERQYAQTFCDTQWRLNRARSYEDNMLALGHFEHADSIAADDPQILAALTAAKAFRDNSKAFVNLSLYEQRLARQQKEAFRQLQELQAQRKAAEAAVENTAANTNKTNRELPKGTATNPPRQFVFSTAEIDRELDRIGDQSPRPDAEFPLGEAA